MSFRQLYLSLAGRLTRSAFNLASLALLAVFIILSVFLSASFGADSSLALYPFAAWGALALAGKRLHDHGKSMWSLLWLLLPLFGPLYLAVLLCCRRGSQGENQYGDDVLQRGADYLQVAAS